MYKGIKGFPGCTSSKEPACLGRRPNRYRFDLWVRQIPWRREWQPSPVFLPRDSHGQRSLVGSKSQTWLKWLHACMFLLMGPPSWLGTWRWEILGSCYFYLKHSMVPPVLFIMLSKHSVWSFCLMQLHVCTWGWVTVTSALGDPSTGVYDSKCY